MAKDLQTIVDGSSKIVFFGGAGVSTESGIPDFRSMDGLYNQKYTYPPETILSHDFFMSYPSEFYRFYKEKMLIKGVKPNAAHLTLAKLERAGRISAVVTQNIDGLHTAAGSRVVYELHGSVLRNHCMKCNKSYDFDYIYVVLYGEGLSNETVDGAVRAIMVADTLIIAGTSLTVYPAAGLIGYFRGKNLVVINKTATDADAEADLVLHMPVGEALGGLKI